jgi:uncharacterized membrane protein YkgB
MALIKLDPQDSAKYPDAFICIKLNLYFTEYFMPYKITIPFLVLKDTVLMGMGFMVFNTTFNNISVISWWLLF